MAEPVVVEDSISRFGLRTVHVMQDGKRPVVADQMARVPDEGRDDLECVVLRDKDLKGIWHLWMHWHIRGVMRVDLQNYGGGALLGVMWHVKKNERYSTAIEAAALRYLVEFDHWPEVAFLRDMKAGMPPVVEWEGDLAIPKVRVELRGAVWMPKGCVFVSPTPSSGHELPERKNRALPLTPPQMKTTFGEGNQEEKP